MKIKANWAGLPCFNVLDPRRIRQFADSWQQSRSRYEMTCVEVQLRHVVPRYAEREGNGNG
jgi:hypothetical protein